jgi:aspartate/methionine/tyrosine aminotransferase
MRIHSYYEWLRNQFSTKRRVLEDGLRAAGIEPLRSSGGFFLLGRLPVLPALSALSDRDRVSVEEEGEPYDWRYCRHLAQQHRVVAIPASPFFASTSHTVPSSANTITNANIGSSTGAGAGAAHFSAPALLGPLARFAFCKRDETLQEAARRLGYRP